ncbi:hypothetical protein ABI_19850 [Asticcacaulis biprosthecium C19]|uniref:DUF4129 domain-containing protein n=1 Tax=Asticcacaulis biprosthecium C19 TaxID=715226 RepID=F4QLP7_9CAUL|nr:hypothetical protein [Asticcacaulis biprosthecium]EGF93545.1 hypothetical protein ABI_19850 [Asticcacaulis biprosthecium C19]
MADSGAASLDSASVDPVPDAVSGAVTGAVSGPVPGNAAGFQHARDLIEQANKAHDIQSSFAPAVQIDPKTGEMWRKIFEAIGKFFGAIGDLLSPLAPIMPFLLYALGIGIILLLLSPVARMFISSRFERFFSRDNLKADKPWRPTKDAVVALLQDIDALAAQGRYDEAVHLLLVRSVADINNFRPDLVRKHFSSRDILSHPLLPEGARPAFRQIVSWVERSYFAGIPVGKEGFDACRKAYVEFVAAEGLA